MGSIGLWSIEAFASVFLPAPVNHQSNHCKDSQTQDGEEDSKEKLDCAHSFLLYSHCKEKG